MWLQQQRLATGTMLALSFTYGIAGSIARELQEDLGTWQQVALQNWGACFLAGLLLWLTQGRLLPAPISVQGRLELVGRAVVGRLIGSFLFIQACMHAPLGTVGWLSALPTSVLFAWLVWGERTSRRELGYLALGFGGVGLVVAPSEQCLSSFGYGELCAVGSVFAFGLSALLGRDAAKEVDIWSATIWLTLITAVTATIVSFALEGGLALPSLAKLPVLLLVVGIVILSSAGSLFGFTHLSAGVASAILSLEAVWAIGIGYLLYGEIPTAFAVLGGGVIVWSAYAIKVSTQAQAMHQQSKDGS
jgi:drug/metabolite transporter (DMT)-like permease